VVFYCACFANNCFLIVVSHENRKAEVVVALEASSAWPLLETQTHGNDKAIFSENRQKFDFPLEVFHEKSSLAAHFLPNIASSSNIQVLQLESQRSVDRSQNAFESA